MKKLVKEYQEGCMKLKKRIAELTAQLRELREAGNEDEIEKLMLEKRIKLLYIEHQQTQETAEYLASCIRRIDDRVKTTAIFR